MNPVVVVGVAVVVGSTPTTAVVLTPTVDLECQVELTGEKGKRKERTVSQSTVRPIGPSTLIR